MFVQRFPARKWNEANGVQNENEENRTEITNVYLLRDWVVIIITSNSIVATTLNQRQCFYIIVEIYLSITIYADKC